MSDQYDSTNSGVIFEPHADQRFTGQGKINIGGADHRVVVIYEKLSKDKPPVRVLYQRMGVLFENDRATSDSAPAFTGPLDQHANLRVAAWKGVKDGRRYMSLKVTEKQQNNGGGGEQPPSEPSGFPDDEIPF